MGGINTIKQVSFLILTLNFSACSLIEDSFGSSTTTHNQTQNLEKLTATSRDNIETNIVKYKSYFDSLDSGYSLMVRNSHYPAGQFTSENEYYQQSTNWINYYGKNYFNSVVKENDLFLSVFLSSDHDFTEYNRQESNLTLFIPKLYICNNSDKNINLNLAIFPNEEPDVIDNQNHHIAQISIPILIDQGFISNQQKDLCIHTEFLDPDFGLGGEHKKWVFNDITIESYKIDALMQSLKNEGIIYDYPTP